MIRLTDARFFGVLLGGVLLAALAACDLVVNLGPANVGDGPGPREGTTGTVHLEVIGASQPLEFWLLAIDPEGGGEETDLTTHDMNDLLPGTYRALVPAVKCTGTCGSPIGPFRCEGLVDVPPFGEEIWLTVAFDAAPSCTISVRP